MKADIVSEVCVGVVISVGLICVFMVINGITGCAKELEISDRELELERINHGYSQVVEEGEVLWKAPASPANPQDGKASDE